MLTDLVTVKDYDTIRLNGPLRLEPVFVDGCLAEIHISDGVASYVIKDGVFAGLQVYQPRAQTQPAKIELCPSNANTANGSSNI